MNSTEKILYHLSRIVEFPLIPPELIIISLTECCNLKCVTCNIKRAITSEALTVDLQKICDIIKQAKEMGIKTAVLSGGEPFLVREIFEIIEYARGLGIQVSVTTNGFYGDDLAEKIAAAGISHLHFSFDGLPEQHDAIRGRGAYERLIRTVGLIKRRSPYQSIGFGTVISSRNCNDLFEMTKIADSLQVNIMNFIPYLVDNTDPQHTGKGCEYSALWPRPEDLVNLKSNFEWISNHRYAYLKLDLNPDLDSLSRYYSLGSIRKRCFAGYKSMIITAQRSEGGRVSSEIFFCQDSCGSVYKETIKEAWISKKAKQMRASAKKCRNPCLQFCHYI